MSSEDITQPIPSQPAERGRRLVSLRAAVTIAAIASLLSVAAAVGISYAAFGNPAPGPRGLTGPPGEVGIQGPRGPAGHASVSEERVWGIIEGDPARAAAAVQDDLDPTPADVQTNVDDVQTNVDQVASDLSSLCTTLSLADALSSEVLVCP